MAPLRWPAVLLLAASVSFGIAALAFWSSDGVGWSSWLAYLPPTAAASAAVCVHGRGRTALIAGAVGTVASAWLILQLAGRWNDDVYEPLLTDFGLAVVILVVGFLPVPLIALFVWAWHAARHSVA